MTLATMCLIQIETFITLPESVEATLVVLVIAKINPELPASISNVGVKACIEGKQNSLFK
jgi:hypothetical protein